MSKNEVHCLTTLCFFVFLSAFPPRLGDIITQCSCAPREDCSDIGAYRDRRERESRGEETESPDARFD